VTDPTLPPALVALDRYRLERTLGQGGMATVYLADDLRHRRRVAFKVLRPELAAVLGRERFLREIETTAGLQHPHILPLFDSGESGGVLYYVMPFVAGGTLRDRMVREGRLPLDEVCRLAREVAGALDHAHARGVLHRDIKPENILLSDGHALVADFGIARLAGGADATGALTTVGLALGTPAYMSPEQALGETDVGPAADQYSLACMVYELLTGALPFRGPTAQAMLAQRLTGGAPSLAAAGLPVPAELEEAMARALEAEPAARFPTLLAFAEALAGGGATGGARPAASPAQAVAVLEFVNVSGAADHDWLGTGIAETVAVDLQRVTGVRVVPLDPAARRLPPTAEHAVAIGRTVGARWVVSGAYQVLGGRIRITPQFHDATSGTALGASKLDGTLDDVFALQDRIVAELLARLAIEPTPTEADEIARPETAALEAYQCYATGRQCFNRFGARAFAEAAGHFRRAIELDPDYALAHAGLGSISVFRFIATTDPADLADGIATLTRAVELDPGRAEPHQWLAYAYTRAERLSDAVAAGRQAVALDPGSPLAHYFLAVALAADGAERREWGAVVSAAEHFHAAIEAEPLYLMSYSGAAGLAMQNGQYADATRLLARAVELEWSGRARSVVIAGTASVLSVGLALREGRHEDAERDIRDLLPRLDALEHLYVPLLRGQALRVRAELAWRREEWDRAVADLLQVRELAERHPRALGMGYLLVRSHLGLSRAVGGLGDHGEAAAQLERGLALFRGRDGWNFSWSFDQTDATILADLAGCHAAAGRRAEALEALAEAVELGWGELAALEHDPAFAALRGDAALAALRERVAARAPLPRFPRAA
jgi:eukaryotic-like serine/threonine-protein kinase